MEGKGERKNLCASVIGLLSTHCAIADILTECLVNASGGLKYKINGRKIKSVLTGLSMSTPTLSHITFRWFGHVRRI